MDEDMMRHTVYTAILKAFEEADIHDAVYSGVQQAIREAFCVNNENAHERFLYAITGSIRDGTYAAMSQKNLEGLE
jgi:hypothetical protein